MLASNTRCGDGADDSLVREEDDCECCELLCDKCARRKKCTECEEMRCPKTLTYYDCGHGPVCEECDGVPQTCGSCGWTQCQNCSCSVSPTAPTLPARCQHLLAQPYPDCSTPMHCGIP